MTKIVETKIDELIPDGKNANKGTEYGQSLVEKSLRKFGAGRSILIDKNNKIIAGNKTVENAANIGLDDVIIVEADGSKIIAVKRNDIDLDSEEGRELAIADNATAKANIDWDVDVMNEISKEWDINPVDWGIEIPETIDLEAHEDDYEIPDEIKTDIVLGDLFEFQKDGKTLHRLLCGDSTDSDQVAKLMNGEKADMVFTDPPYEIDIDYTNILLFSENCHVFIFNNDRALIRQLSNSSLTFKNFFVFYHSGTAIPQEGGNEIFLDHVLVSHEINGHPKVRYNKGNGTRSVIKGEYRRSENHKYEKPISFLSPIIEGYSDENFIILDLFAGGGSMYSAAHQLNRKCYGMELDPKYCQVIIDRMLSLFPEIKINKNGMPYNN